MPRIAPAVTDRRRGLRVAARARLPPSVCHDDRPTPCRQAAKEGYRHSANWRQPVATAASVASCLSGGVPAACLFGASAFGIAVFGLCRCPFSALLLPIFGPAGAFWALPLLIFGSARGPFSALHGLCFGQRLATSSRLRCGGSCRVPPGAPALGVSGHLLPGHFLRGARPARPPRLSGEIVEDSRGFSARASAAAQPDESAPGPGLLTSAAGRALTSPTPDFGRTRALVGPLPTGRHERIPWIQGDDAPRLTRHRSAPTRSA